jgi:CubicO group peptidase (beta-lactamase class C family)
MRNLLCGAALAGVSVASLAVPGAAARSSRVAPPAEYAPVESYLRQAVADGLTPSVAVAVIRGGKVVWAEGFGEADRARHTPATPDSIYLLASVSKPITATGLMVLVDEGKIDLDQPANRYLQGAALRAPGGDPALMTIRRLANHTSGLPVHYSFYYAGTTPPPREETIRRYGFANWTPATRWEYSNLAFGILDHVITRVSGQPFGQFLERRVLDPIGMTRTSDHVRAKFASDATVQYTRRADGAFVAVPPYAFDHPGASTMWSSALDLARFAQLHLNDGELDGHRVLSVNAAREMKRLTGVSAPGTGTNTGTGTGVAWGVGPYGGHASLSHTGGMPGVSTHVRLYPEINAATVVLTNADDRTVSREATRRLAQVLFPDAKFDDVAATPAAAAVAAAVVSAGAAVRPVASTSALRGAWKGRLLHVDGDIALRLIVKDEGKVDVQWGAQPAEALTMLRLSDTELEGRVQAFIPTQAGFHGVPMIRFDLRREGDRLVGLGVATADGYFALSHRVELEKESE